MATFLIPRNDEPETLEIPVEDGGKGFVSIEILVPKLWTHLWSQFIDKPKTLEKKFSKLIPKLKNFVFGQRLDLHTKLFLALLEVQVNKFQDPTSAFKKTGIKDICLPKRKNPDLKCKEIGKKHFTTKNTLAVCVWKGGDFSISFKLDLPSSKFPSLFRSCTRNESTY